jgi:molecular chaperone DnaK (HSP70)
MSRAIGIDLGTTNSVMATMRRGTPIIIDNVSANRDITPSVVSRARRGELLVGAAAKGRAGADPRNTIYSVKRFMGRHLNDPLVQRTLSEMDMPYEVTAGPDGDVRVTFAGRPYSPIEISSLILYQLKQDAETRLKEPVQRAVITVPAYFGERQVAATREAGRLAGFHVLRILNEPTAAARAYGLSRNPDDPMQTVLVYDLGGGTFDISILLLMEGVITVLGIEGDNLLGGDDFDQLIIRKRALEELRRQHGAYLDLSNDPTAMSTLRAEAEKAKIALSNQLSTDVLIPALGDQKIDLEFEMLRGEFEQLIEDKLQRTIELTLKAIREAHLTLDQIDQVLLVGGSTAIPRVAQLLGDLFGEEKLRRDVNPMQCVALGAAVVASDIGEVDCPKCGAINPVVEDTCRSCGSSLIGSPKQLCPSCYVPSDVGETSCWKCGTTLQKKAVPSEPGQSKPPLTASPKPAPTTNQVCPRCGKPAAPGATECTICHEPLIDPGGRQCPNCKEVNLPGAIVCRRCQAPLATEILVDITSKSLGIELVDGRMAVLIDKGTPFPLTTPSAKDFYTTVDGQARLDVAVFEGEQPIAQQNEMCGMVTVMLPPSMPRTTPVSIGLGLDRSRTIQVEVKVRGSDVVRKATFSHNLDPERIKKVATCREEVLKFVDQWNEELTTAERQSFQDTLSEIEAATQVDSVRAPEIEPMLRRVMDLTGLARSVRGTDAWLSAIRRNAGRYIDRTKLAELEQIQSELQTAREHADWEAGRTLLRREDEATSTLGGRIILIVNCVTLAEQHKISQGLAQRVFTARGHIDEGLNSGDAQDLEAGLSSLESLWPDIKAELDAQGEVIKTGGLAGSPQ